MIYCIFCRTASRIRAVTARCSG